MEIRKLSIGQNLPDTGIHYQVGSKVRSREHEVAQILFDQEAYRLHGDKVYRIYTKNVPKSPDDVVSVVLWKIVENLPAMVEMFVDYE